MFDRRRFIHRLLRLGRIDAEFDEVKVGRYKSKTLPFAIAPGSKLQPTAQELTKLLYAESLSRKDALDKKVASLMSLTGILLPLTITLFVFTLDWTKVGLLFLIPFIIVTALLLGCAFLLLEFLRLNSFSQPDINQAFVDATDEEQKYLLAQDFLTSADYNYKTNQYLADVYRAARRYFIVALVVATILGWAAATVKICYNEPDPEKRLFNLLKSDPELVALLRGPVGPQGTVGADGKMGPKGDDGKPGPPGKNAVTTRYKDDPKSLITH